MKRLILISVCSLLCLAGFAQNEQAEIDRQVWIPFMESYSSFAGERFIQLHAEDMIRVLQNSGKIKSFKEYASDIREWWPKQLEKGSERKLELRFTERIATETDAFEVGIYKVIYPKPDGTSESHYGKFHVTLKKSDGIWKIKMDADSNYGKTIGEKDFAGAKPISQN